ncbi:MAG: TetR/AcrR family transcriptional regulator [Lachnospiraceae bacterium]|nr:TetR/AcrR family transcriptional regulator [Lachnospiraceae bacterium]
MTIKDITDEAGVIRPTFYHHFRDKYAVIEKILWDEVLMPVIPLLENQMINEAILLIFKNLYKEKEFYCSLSHMEGQNSFSQIVTENATKLLGDYLKQNTERKHFKKKWITVDMVAEYYAKSLALIALSWISQKMPIPPEELAEVYFYLMTNSMEDVVAQMESE